MYFVLKLKLINQIFTVFSQNILFLIKCVYKIGLSVLFGQQADVNHIKNGVPLNIIVGPYIQNLRIKTQENVYISGGYETKN